MASGRRSPSSAPLTAPEPPSSGTIPDAPVVTPTDDRPTATTLEVAVEIPVPPATAAVHTWAAATATTYSRASAAATATTWAAASAATNASASSAPNASAASASATALGVRRCEDQECSCCYCDKRKLAEHYWLSRGH